MVIPCSRSASSPSVRSDRSMSSWPRFCDARATAASWSSKMARVSCSSRPISVLLPSSTLPAVMNRSTPRSSEAWALRSISPSKLISGVGFLLAPLHGGFRSLIVHARRPALGDRGQRRLGDDLGGRRGGGFHRAGATYVANGAEAHRELFHFLAFARRSDVANRNEQAVSAHDGPAVGIIDRGHGKPFERDVLPYVELGPVADGEYTHVLALRHAGVVKTPQLRALVLRVPLAEFVAERKHAFLGARLFLVSAGPPDRGIETELGDRLQQRYRLPGIPAFVGPAKPHRSPAHPNLERAHDDPAPQLRCARVAERDYLREIMPGVDVHERKWKLRGAEGFLGQAQQHDRILSAGEEQHRVGTFAGDFAQDENRFRLEQVEMVAGGQRAALGPLFLQDRAHASLVAVERASRPSAAMCSPHSRASRISHHQRPARTSSPATVGRVHGAQPMER